MMEITKLVDEIIECEAADKAKMLKMISRCIEDECCESLICEKLYKECYDYLLPEMCEELIEEMSNEEKSGAIWTIEDTNNVARKLDIDFATKPYTPDEFRAVMTMEYYEHNIPLKKSGATLEPTGWGRLADYALTNNPKKLVDYYFD